MSLKDKMASLWEWTGHLVVFYGTLFALAAGACLWAYLASPTKPETTTHTHIKVVAPLGYGPISSDHIVD